MHGRLISIIGAALAVALSACGDPVTPTAPDRGESLTLARSVGAGDGYIVVFNRDVTDAPGLAQRLVTAHGGDLRFTYQHALKGFAAQLSATAAQALERNPNVAYVERDGIVTTMTTQNNATWGLDRIDQRDLPLNGTYTYDFTGAGVNVYIVDTGIRLAHNEFTGRVFTGFDAVTADGTANDCHGHGTHVAGTVGGTIYGVAKGAKLFAVRVLDCNGSGTTAGVIAGVDWVTANHVKPAVANMSLGGGASTALDDAVRNSISAGVSYAVAAGNGDFIGRAQNACNYSPARVAEAMTVGATTNTDAKASWSNYGSCVNIFAPGVSITSAWHSSNTATNTISGTSMASPHVAGVAALYLQANNGATPLQVRTAIYNNATPDKVTSSSTTNPLLLYSLFGGTAPPPDDPDNSAPTAKFSQSCADLTCQFTDESTDSDGTIVSWAWEFGDGGTHTEQNPSHTYGAAGTYNVKLTVTDNGGATGSVTKSVSVTAPSTGFVLSGSATKVRGVNHAELSWTGAPSGPRTLYRDGGSLTTLPDGTNSYTHDTGGRGGGSAVYRVCVDVACSNPLTISW